MRGFCCRFELVAEPLRRGSFSRVASVKSAAETVGSTEEARLRTEFLARREFGTWCARDGALLKVSAAKVSRDL
jgi:hypothetical protein